MQLVIHNGKVDLSGVNILKNINIEINTGSKIAIIGRNGSGKTTLLKTISGEIPLSKAEGDDSFYSVTSHTKISMLDQMAFADNNITLIDAVREAYSDIINMKKRLDSMVEKMETNNDGELIHEYSNLLDTFTNLGGFYFEKEYEAAIKGMGFCESDKHRLVSEFSGGQRTKIAFLKLLLSKPDILLLDEPTNHLDINAVNWLESYIRDYKKAVVIVSHDRMFLDRTINEVYEIEHGKTTRFTGNYTEYTKKKKELKRLKEKQYIAQQKEIKHLTDLADRFRYKATKASMAQSKLKQIERMEIIEAPERDDDRIFKANLECEFKSAKDVLTARNLVIGFDYPLADVSFDILRGDRLAIIGGNGLGKSTLLKTLVGNMPAISGSFKFGNGVRYEYFDQQMAQYTGNITVLDEFRNSFPHLNDFEARSALGAFLFSGEDVFKTLNMLSGGEKVRLALCKIFRKKPNLLILDEPTNHMDILSKEALEDILSSFEGTLIFVSHDRYFVQKLSDKLLVFEEDKTAKFYRYGFYEYQKELEEMPVQKNLPEKPDTLKTVKKGYTTPAKEKAKKEREIKKCEEKISMLENKVKAINQELSSDEIVSDYVRLSELTSLLEKTENELADALEEWEAKF